MKDAVLVTGCSSGIGHATALELLARGYRVYATARKPDALADLAQRGCRTLALDVTDEESMTAAVAAVEEEAGFVWALVNNAGYAQMGAVESVPIDAVRRQFETNVFGLVRMCQLVLPGMRDAGRGRIVNIGSMGGRLTFPGSGVYSATKYALESISDALRYEVAGMGIRVVLLEPGLIKTGFAAAADASAAATDADGPYREFNRDAVDGLVEVYETGMAKVAGGGPDDVAATVRKALDAKHPKARYTVTPSAKVLIAQRALMPDRLWDRSLRAMVPAPPTT